MTSNYKEGINQMSEMELDSQRDIPSIEEDSDATHGDAGKNGLRTENNLTSSAMSRRSNNDKDLAFEASQLKFDSNNQVDFESLQTP